MPLLIQKTTAGVSHTSKAAVLNVALPKAAVVSHIQKATTHVADVQMAAMDFTHVQESDTVDAPHVQESAAVAHQVQVPNCTGPHVHKEVESYVEPEPNQSNYVYAICGKRHCSSWKFHDKVKLILTLSFESALLVLRLGDGQHLDCTEG